MILGASLIPTVVASPSFVRQEALDADTPNFVDINSLDATPVLPVDTGLTDILSVNYNSNGSIVDATVWLASPLFKNKQNATDLKYGMYIDADFNDKTGYKAADYEVLVSRNDANKTWERSYFELAAPLVNQSNSRTIEHHDNFSDFYKNGSNYVNLYADLMRINSPDKYRILFFAEQLINGSWFADFTNWISIPPTDLNITSSSDPIIIGQIGAPPASVELELRSRIPNIVNVTLYGYENLCNINAKFHPSTILVDSSGFASTEMTVSIPGYGTISTCTLPIFANVTVPPESILQPKIGNITASSASQPIQISSYVNVKILSPLEQFHLFLADWFNPITAVISTVIAIGSAVGGYVYGKRA
jgi:hypothetical protein